MRQINCIKKSISLLNETQKLVSELDNDDLLFNLLEKTQSTLDNTFSLLQYCFKSLEYSVTSAKLTQSKLDNLKLNISSQKDVVAAAILSVQSAEQSR